MSNERTLGQLVGEAMNVWRSVLDRRLRPLGLSQARWRVLLHAARADTPLTQSELASRLYIGGPSLVSLIDRMEADGWIKRRRHETDRRRNLIYLSPRAGETLQLIEAEVDRVYRELIEGLDPTDIETAKTVLCHIRARGEALESGIGDSQPDTESDE